MGFEFSDHKVEVEICGVGYVIDLGDLETLEAVDRWGAKLKQTSYADLGDEKIAVLTEDLRNYLAALLGEKQFAEVFAQRAFTFVDGLELFAYLYSEVVKHRASASLAANLKKYMPEMDWQGGEA